MRNISRSGLLFTAQQLHPVNTRIELTFALPTVIPDEPSATVRCEGDIARSVLSTTEIGQPAIAIRIAHSELMRTPASPARGAEAGKR
jgi:hypothetical protein